MDDWDLEVTGGTWEVREDLDWDQAHLCGAMDVQEPDYDSWAWKHRNGAMPPPEGWQG